MIRSSVDLPEPLRPSTPILAPGRKLSEMSLSTCLSGGCVRDSLYMVKMYWLDMRRRRIDPSRMSTGGRAILSECPFRDPPALGDKSDDEAADRRHDLGAAVERRRDATPARRAAARRDGARHDVPAGDRGGRRPAGRAPATR